MIAPIAYTVKAAADAVGVDQTTIRKAINHGQLRARYAGRRILIETADLTAWLRALPTEPPREDKDGAA